MNGRGDDMRPGEGRFVPDRGTVVPDRPRNVAPFTPEQVEFARGYAEASCAASTQAKYLQH